MSDLTAKQYLIKGGTIVDGTGAPAFRGDVRVAEGTIVEIGVDLSPTGAEERVVDASACVVSPGFIESHTHFDGAMWWDQTLDPLPGFGATTVVMGNCGFTVAPVPDDEAVRRELVGIFSFFEDIPDAPFMSELPWDWQSWPEYRESMERKAAVPTNYAAFCGHIALRLAVLGMDAWERAATADEIQRMASMLDEALSAGALGLSSNLMDHDGEDRPVPSMHADDAEFRALFEVLEKHPGATFQVILDTFRNMKAPEQLQRLASLSEGLNVRVQWAGLPTLVFQRDLMGIQAPLAELHESLKAQKRDFWTGFAHIPVTSTASVQSSLIFAQSNDYVWHEVVLAEGDAAKLALLNDTAWRERARQSWDSEVFEFSPFSPNNSANILLLNSENNVGPMGITLGDYAQQIGAPHPSDAMADWLIANGLESTVTMPPFEMDLDMVIKLIRDDQAVGNISDAGAHGQMLCGGGENIRMFTDLVANGHITLEEAVRVQTGKLAEFFGFKDRGFIQVGMRADLAVFSLDEVKERAMKKVYDVPMGDGSHTWRWTRDAAPMRLTMVNGVPTFQDGTATDARPGELLTPSVVVAEAARKIA